MRYRYKRLTGLTRRSIGVPQMHAAGPRDWGAPGVHTLHDGYVAWVLAFGSKPRGQRKQ